MLLISLLNIIGLEPKQESDHTPYDYDLTHTWLMHNEITMPKQEQENNKITVWLDMKLSNTILREI